MTDRSREKPLLLVATSTLPRWPDDTEPRFVQDLSERLARTFRVAVVAPHAPGAAREERLGDLHIQRFRYFPERFEQLAYEGGIVPKLRRRRWLWLLVPFFLAAEVLALARVLRRERVAAIHAHWLIPQGLCAWLALRVSGRTVPLVCTLHGADVFALHGGLLKRLQGFIARRCDILAPVSAAIADEVLQLGVARERIRILPMGVSTPSSVAPVARDPAHLIFAGRLVEKKGVPVLLRAVARLRDRGVLVQLTIAGDGPERARCEALSRELSLATRFTGAIPNSGVLDLFRRATIAVMPSVVAADGDSEGLGLVALEAMGCACPVVASDLPAVKTYLRDGENGFLFRAGDEVALADTLARALGNDPDRRRVGEAGVTFVRESFGWERAAQAYADVLLEAVSHASSSAARVSQPPAAG